jgi:hypothetical protein
MPVDSVVRNVSEDRAFSFFYVSNRERLDAFLAAPRLVTLVFALGIGVLLFIISRAAPPVFFLTVLAFWAFEPTFLAFAATAKPDIPLAFFCLACLLIFQRGRKEGRRWDLLAGVLAGAAVACKLTGLALIPLLLLMDLWEAKASKGFHRELSARSRSPAGDPPTPGPSGPLGLFLPPGQGEALAGRARGLWNGLLPGPGPSFP